MTAALEGGEWSAARPGRNLSLERPGTQCTGGWTGEKSRPHGDSIPDCPSRSSVAIPTELPGPGSKYKDKGKVYLTTRLEGPEGD